MRVSTWSAAAASSALSMSMRIKARAKIVRECQTATAQASHARIVPRVVCAASVPEEEASPSLYVVFSEYYRKPTRCTGRLIRFKYNTIDCDARNDDVAVY